MTGRTITRFAILVGIACVVRVDHALAAQPAVEWSRQWGTSGHDLGLDATADQLGNIYIAGGTGYNFGALTGAALLAKYNAAGNLVWTRQLAATTSDQAWSVSTDPLGNIYTSGITGGRLNEPNAGHFDAFLAKYSANGNLTWVHQLGSSADEYSYGVSADALGNVFFTGTTDGNLGGTSAGGTDSFISKYNAAGVRQWVRQLGTNNGDVSYGVATDGLGNAYIVGATGGNLGMSPAGDVDAFLAKYDTAGNLLWTKQFGSSASDEGDDVAVDPLGNIYVAGATLGVVGQSSGGFRDVFISKFDAAGVLQWSRQLGASDAEYAEGIDVDAFGNVYLSGTTNRSLAAPNAGGEDAFVTKYDSSGNLQWIRQFGTSTVDDGLGVATDSLGSVYLTGRTLGSLGGPSAGNSDLFLIKLVDVPEPSALALTSAGALLLVMKRRRQTYSEERSKATPVNVVVHEFRKLMT